MLRFKFLPRFFVIIFLVFILFTIIGTLTHELGHIAVAKYYGYETSINYGSMSYSLDFSEDEDVKVIEEISQDYINIDYEDWPEDVKLKVEDLNKIIMAKKLIEKSYGYAVFSNTGYNIILYVGGKGKGVAFKNSDKKPIFMTMLNAGTGPGVGYTEYRQVLIFDSEDLFKQFTTIGLNASASANATIKLGHADIDESGVVALVPGVSAYHINDKGVDVQANWGGMKYFKDDELN